MVGMTPSHRAWAERFVAQLEARVALYARIGTGREGEVVILSCLQEVVDRHRAALGAAIVTPAADTTTPVPVTEAPAGRGLRSPYPPGFEGEPGSTNWSNPVFWADGFDPFAGTFRDHMLASAAVWRSLGAEEAALLYEARAAGDGTVEPPDRPTAAIEIDEAAQARLAAVSSFSAGQQMGLFG